MLTVEEWVDKTHEITNELEHEASIKKNSELARTNAFYDGYIQACEDFCKRMRRAISEKSRIG